MSTLPRGSTSPSRSTPNKSKIKEFLELIDPQGLLNLAAIKPDGYLVGVTFDMPSEADKAAAWVKKMNLQGYNVYFTVNPVKKSINGKPYKNNIAQAVACWLDIDPDTSHGYKAGRAELLNSTLPKLQTGPYAATMIIDSGNGLQAFYYLKSPTDDLDRVESVNRQFEELFGSDHTHNIDRLMRVPGTINYPNKAKLDKGYPEEPSMAQLLVSNGPRYTLEKLEQILPASPPSPRSRLSGIKFSEDQSPLTESEKQVAIEKLEQLLKVDLDLYRRWNKPTEGLTDKSRSGMDMSLGSLLKKRGFSYREMRHILITWAHGAGSEKSDSNDERYFQRIWQNSSVKTSGEVTRALDTVIASGNVNASDLLPLIADANLCATDVNKCIQHLVDRVIGGKQNLKNDLKQYVQERQDANLQDREDVIICYEHLLPEIVDKISQILKGDEAPVVFLRGGNLCQITRQAPNTVNGIVNKEWHLMIEHISITQMVDSLSRRFDFFKPAAGIKLKQICCPNNVAQTLLERSGQSLQPPLAALAHTPTLKPDGTVLFTPGYDRLSGLFLVDSPLCNIDIPDKPTKKQAKAALEILMEPFRDFPFDDKVSKAVLIAAVLTAIVRPILRSAPMFLFDATKMSTGKSLLVNTITMIADGRTCPGMMSYTKNDDEMRKRILSILISGSNIVCIDNVSITVENDTLCTVLTEPVFEDRILGKNEQARVPTATTWIITGNAIRVAGDLSTRTLQCRLDAEVENPEERRFERNLYEWVPEHRAELVTAALTILRAYQVARASLKDKIPPWGRFDDWSRIVRKPLVWLGMKDPYLSNALIQAYDPVREELGAILEAWHKAFGREPMLLKDVIALVVHPGSSDPNGIEGLYDLKDILGHVIHRDLSSRSLGAYIKKYKGRIEDGYRMVEAGKRDKTALWRVEKVPV